MQFEEMFAGIEKERLMGVNILITLRNITYMQHNSCAC